MFIAQKHLRQLAKYSLVYLLILAGYFLFFILLIRSPLFSDNKILFYRGLQLLVLETTLLFLITSLTRFKIKFSFGFLSNAIIVSFCLTLTFFILVPVTLDRSVSTFLLSKMSENSSKGISKEQLNNIFINEYVSTGDAVGRRLNEQMQSRSVEKTGEYYRVSNSGKRLLFFFEFIKILFSIP